MSQYKFKGGKMKQINTLLVAVLLMLAYATTATADSFFYAVNQFTTIQKINGDTGAVVDFFAAPTNLSEASIAVVGNIGYYTNLGDANVYAVNMTTHASLGVAFNTGNSGFMNGITNDAAGNLWFAHGGSGASNVLQEFNTAGALLGTWAFPTAASSYRDGSVVFGGFVVANRGDQQGPYDKYTFSGGNLAYLNQPFIVDPFSNSGNNGIGFNGVNYYVANEQVHVVRKYDINGNFISSANLDPGSRYENWTFASQDIVVGPVPEPSALLLLGSGLVGLGYFRRRRGATN